MKINKFENLEEASIKLSEVFLQIFNEKEKISAAFAGGSTPQKFFSILGKKNIKWKNLSLILTDERWVPISSDESNEKSLRKFLPLEKINFFPLKTDDSLPEKAAVKLNENIKKFPLPFNIVVLGMGEDGHVASIFPSTINLERKSFSIAKPKDAPQRISLSLKTILNSEKIILLIAGEIKLKLVENILIGGYKNLPVSAILNQTLTPVEIFWAAK